MSSIEALARELSRLPGIGRKTATRLAYHLAKTAKAEVRQLADAVSQLADRIRPCRICGSFSDEERCQLCQDPSRDSGTICVVEEAYEVAAIDRSGGYRGLFHVLGGRLSPLDGIGPEKLNIDGLVERVRETDGTLKEVILATNASVEGEATAVYIEHQLRSFRLRVTRLARGIPVGSDLEYVDGTTIAEALAGRREAAQ